MNTLIPPLPKKMTRSSPSSAPAAVFSRSELVVKIEGDPIIKANDKKVTYVLVRE
jgi:hypothetical protein